MANTKQSTGGLKETCVDSEPFPADRFKSRTVIMGSMEQDRMGMLGLRRNCGRKLENRRRFGG